jgi:hypothetical protein
MPRPTLPVPADFARYASIEGNLKLRKRYNVGGATIERWRATIGARYNRPAMPKNIPVAIKKRIRARFRAWDGQGQERLEDLDDFDMADAARSFGVRVSGREW